MGGEALMCKHFRRKLVDRYGRIMAILAPAGARNAWEIKRCLFTMLSPTRNIIGADMEMIESNVRTTLYSIANTATITVPPVCERDDMRLSDSGMQRWRPRKPCIVLDGELPIP